MNGYNSPHFRFQDFSENLPDPGYYPCIIHTARFCTSTNGNSMLQVAFCLHTVASIHRIVLDHFVFDGPRVSPAGILRSRFRLLELYHACGLQPMDEDQIIPEQLLDAQLQVRVEHEVWQGRTVLRVTDYLPLSDAESHSSEESL